MGEFFYNFVSLPISYEIMTRCWKTEPKQRPTFAEIYELLNGMLVDDKVNKKTSKELSP